MNIKIFIDYLRGFPRSLITPSSVSVESLKNFLDGDVRDSLVDPIIFDKKSNSAGTILELALLRLDNHHYSGNTNKYKEDLLEIINKIVDKQPKLILIRNDQNFLPIHVAILHCSFNISSLINILVRDINIKELFNITDTTLLHFACDPEDGTFSPETVHEILKLYENHHPEGLIFGVNNLCQKGMTALHLTLTYHQDSTKENSAFEIVKKLLLAGAYTTLEYKTAPKEITTSLHYATKYCSYRIIKLLLSNSNTDINKKDSNGKTPLHIAIERGDQDIVFLFLRQPNINVIGIDLKILNNVPSKIAQFFTEKRKEIMQLSEGQTHWIKSLNLSYTSSKKNKRREIIINGEDNHFLLKAKESISRPPLNSSVGNGTPNQVTAAFTFVVTDKKGNIYDILIEVDDATYRQIRNFANFSNEDNKVDRVKYAEHLRSMLSKLQLKTRTLSINKIQDFPPRLSQQIDPNDKNFDISFLHSEQALFYYLVEDNGKNLTNIINKLILSMHHNEKSPKKIVAIILNIYSEKYMCENCQAMAIALLSDDKLKNMLIEKLINSGLKIKKDMPTTILLTANKPVVSPKENEERYRFTEVDHKVEHVDLRLIPKGHLFFKDVSKSKIDITIFTSRFNEQISKLQTENANLKVENESLKVENDRLKRTHLEEETTGSLSRPNKRKNI